MLALNYGAFFLPGIPRYIRDWLYPCITVYLAVLMTGKLIGFHTSASPWVYFSLGQALICGFIGCRIGQTPHAAEWTLKMLARAAAVLSVYKFLTPEPLEGASFPPVGVGWPVQLFILFGFCWYVSAAISAPRPSKEMILAASACVLEVFVAFHKPVVFAGLSSLVSLVLIEQFLPKRRERGSLRLIWGAGLLAIAMFAAFKVTGGVLLERYREEFFVKYLHMSANASQGMFELDETTVERFSGGRFDLWSQAVDLFWKSPWVGSGPAQRFYSRGQEVHAHDGYLELLYSVGVVGALAHIGAAWIWLQHTIFARGLALRARLIIPIAAYIGGFLGYETGGGATALYTLLSFVYLLAGIALGYSVGLQPVAQSSAGQRQSVALRTRSQF